jgi:NAD(P)-dependent dehydrogenase (short-subunit alcohol dehydrogenase family)
MPTILVTGAARGLGLEFVRQYRAGGWEVIAAARDSGGELGGLGAEILTLDMTHFDAVAAFKVDRPLDLLIANAGVYGPGSVTSADDAAQWLDVFKVNSVAPALLFQAVRPQLGAGSKAIAISSQMGSIDDSSTGSIPYRSSKAALNMAWHVLANENRGEGIAMATLHPGWVQTDMGGKNAAIDAATSVRGMRRVIDGLTIERTGGFYAYDGRELAW